MAMFVTCRFYGLRYPDTRYITQPSPGTSQHLDPSDMYMPKSHPQYSGYQQEDKDRVAKHKGQVRVQGPRGFRRPGLRVGEQEGKRSCL